mmetsp:Transcript_119769/g.374517  ORF Transcript_119769/g.374517 Transcript_119769/m.374517 type:complete len:265 (-) Transcript_119769:91-885(-)
MEGGAGAGRRAAGKVSTQPRTGFMKDGVAGTGWVTVDANTAAQRAKFQREALRRQLCIADRVREDADSSSWGGGQSVRPPWALALQEDPRALPSQAPGGRPYDALAGLITPRDLIGAPAIGGTVDFGMEMPPQPRGRPLGRERFQAVGASAVAAAEAPRQGLAGSAGRGLDGGASAFQSPRRRPLGDESPRMMKHRGLRSAPRNMGFVYPTMRPGTTEQAPMSNPTAQAPASSACTSYPLSHNVLKAQFRTDGVLHCYSNSVGC